VGGRRSAILKIKGKLLLFSYAPAFLIAQAGRTPSSRQLSSQATISSRIPAVFFQDVYFCLFYLEFKYLLLKKNRKFRFAKLGQSAKTSARPVKCFATSPGLLAAAHRPDIVVGGLIVGAHVATAEVHVPGAERAVLSRRPIAVRLIRTETFFICTYCR